MTEEGAESSGPAHPRVAHPRVNWAVDSDRRLLVITLRGGVTDDDLLAEIPRIWEEHPEVIGYDSLVDARRLTSEGGWTWPALREIARQWRAFARGGDLGRRTAIVTQDSWVRMLVGAFVLDYQGRKFRSFGCPDDAVNWVAPP